MAMDRFFQGLSISSAWTFLPFVIWIWWYAECLMTVIDLVLELRMNLYFMLVSMVSIHRKCICFYGTFPLCLLPPTHRYLSQLPIFKHWIDSFHHFWQSIPIGSVWHLFGVFQAAASRCESIGSIHCSW
eukprot:209525_1